MGFSSLQQRHIKGLEYELLNYFDCYIRVKRTKEWEKSRFEAGKRSTITSPKFDL
jgi:hypothetical protein